MMEVVVTTEAINRAKIQSNHHHQQTNTQFFTVQMPFLSPNQQCQSTEGNMTVLCQKGLATFFAILYFSGIMTQKQIIHLL